MILPVCELTQRSSLTSRSPLTSRQLVNLVRPLRGCVVGDNAIGMVADVGGFGYRGRTQKTTAAGDKAGFQIGRRLAQSATVSRESTTVVVGDPRADQDELHLRDGGDSAGTSTTKTSFHPAGSAAETQP